MSDDDYNDLLRKSIKDMTKEELVEEIVIDWRSKLMKEDTIELKKNVITLRTAALQNRLLKEAGLKLEHTHNLLGTQHRLVEEDDD